jgi:hypothetical protein
MYIKVSPNRVFFLDEYWILIPLMLAIDIAIIVKVKKNRAKKKLKLKQLKEKCGILKIFHIATGNILAALQIRAGENGFPDLVEGYIEILHPTCIVGKGVRFIDSERLRKIVHALHKSKAKNGVIFITKSALCYLVEMYGLNLPAFPVPIPDFIGFLGWYQLARKIISVGCLGIPLPMVILAQGPTSIIWSLVAWGFGIVLAALIKDPGFVIVPTTLIYTSVTPIELIQRRIPDRPDLVSLDLEFVSPSKITMPEFSRKYECLLPEQKLLNPGCSLRPSEISGIAENADISVPYRDVVNLQDVTKMNYLEFSDQFEVSTSRESTKPTTNFKLRGTKRFKEQSKTVNFLKKFGDPEFISDAEQWDITTSTPKDAIRIPDL